MGVVVRRAQVVHVVVGHERQIELAGQPDQVRVDPLLLQDVVPLQLDEEAGLAPLVGAERLRVPPRLLDRLLEVGLVLPLLVLHEVMSDRAAEVTVDGDQPLAPLGQGRAVHAGAVVEAVQIGVRGELEQIAPALIGFREQHEVESAGAGGAGRPLEAITGRDVRFDSQDRLDAGSAGRAVELDGAEEVAVIGDGHRVHAQLGHPIDQAADAVAAVEERVLGVQVQVDELRAGRCGGAVRCGGANRFHWRGAGRRGSAPGRSGSGGLNIHGHGP